jgi:SEC-C motif-containing protein
MTKIKIGRNDPCHCGSGQKYKRCCLEQDQRADSAALAQAAADRLAATSHHHCRFSFITALFAFQGGTFSYL